MAPIPRQYSNVWVVAVAVQATPGERLIPIVVAAKAVGTDCIVEMVGPIQSIQRSPPYPTGPDTLLVTIDANQVVGCHLDLGWRVPERIVDLMVEFRNRNNGEAKMLVGGLAGALLCFGLSALDGIACCNSAEQIRRRVDVVEKLFRTMECELDIGRALLRGRFMCAVARMEATGVPVDHQDISRLKNDWPTIRDRVFTIIDRDFGFYSGQKFNLCAFATWLDRHSITWPQLEKGPLDLSDDAFKEMSRIYPQLQPIKELRATLSDFDPGSLVIGHDGRNRTPLRPFSSRTGRNQPSAKASVLGSAVWARHLVKPQAGTGLAYLDWQQQEFGIAAALSEDRAMQSAYHSSDPYMAMAITANAAPACAMATSHPIIREQFKACALGVQYGMGATTLARQLQCSESKAQALLAAHRATFPRYWSWSDNVENSALLNRELQSVFGWRLAVGPEANTRALRNFPAQANGAEMLRLACCLATENGIRVCAPNHDALLIEAPLDELDATIYRTRQFMAEASATVLDGFRLRTDVKVIRAPDRWTNKRGEAVWSAVQRALAQDVGPARQYDRTCPPAHTRPISLYVFKKDSIDVID